MHLAQTWQSLLMRYLHTRCTLPPPINRSLNACQQSPRLGNRLTGHSIGQQDQSRRCLMHVRGRLLTHSCVRPGTYTLSVLCAHSHAPCASDAIIRCWFRECFQVRAPYPAWSHNYSLQACPGKDIPALRVGHFDLWIYSNLFK